MTGPQEYGNGKIAISANNKNELCNLIVIFIANLKMTNHVIVVVHC